MQTAHGKTVEPRRQRGLSHRFWSRPLRLWRSFVRGIAELSSFAHPARRITYPHANVSSALKGDWVKIGLGMRTVIRRK